MVGQLRRVGGSSRLLRQAGLLACALLGLTACTLGPNYERPASNLPDYVIPPKEAADIAGLHWWTLPGDAELLRLIKTALGSNLTLKAAASRVDVARAGVMVVQSNLYPHADYGSGVTRVHKPGEHRRSFETLIQPQPSVSWTVDVWGRVRRQVESAEALAAGAEEGRRAAVLMIVSEVAETYVRLRAAETQYNITQDSIARLNHDLQAMKNATPSASEVAQAQLFSSIERYRANLPLLSATADQAENDLRLLCADPYLKITRGRGFAGLKTPIMPHTIRSDVLLRRPDVAQAEQRLIAANAQIGAEMALYLPQIHLSASGGIGYSSLFPGPMPGGLTPVWALAGNVVGPLFAAGAITGKVDIAKGETEMALAEYQESLLTAFRDTKNALIAYQRSTKHLEALLNSEKALESAVTKTEDMLGKTPREYTGLILLHNELYQAQIESALARKGAFDAVVNVYKATGGGWVDEAAVYAPQPKPPADRVPIL